LRPCEARQIPQLFQISPHDIDQLLGGSSLSRILGGIRVQDMEPDMALDEFAHQAIQRSPASRYELEHVRALVFFPECAFHGLNLSANSTNSAQKLFFVSRCVRHEASLIYYNPV
jgi:hypothetical protein